MYDFAPLEFSLAIYEIKCEFYYSNGERLMMNHFLHLLCPFQIILIYIHGGLEKVNKINTQKIILKDHFLQSTISVISSQVLDAG